MGDGVISINGTTSRIIMMLMIPNDRRPTQWPNKNNKAEKTTTKKQLVYSRNNALARICTMVTRGTMGICWVGTCRLGTPGY